MKARFVSNSFTIGEAGEVLEVVQGLLEGCSLNVGVEYTITFNTEATESTANGTDIRHSTAAISFQPADLSKSLDFSLYIEDDCILEANEAVNLVLVEVDASVSRVVSPHSAILEIVDDDSKSQCIIFVKLALYKKKLISSHVVSLFLSGSD